MTSRLFYGAMGALATGIVVAVLVLTGAFDDDDGSSSGSTSWRGRSRATRAACR